MENIYENIYENISNVKFEIDCRGKETENGFEIIMKSNVTMSGETVSTTVTVIFEKA